MAPMLGVEKYTYSPCSWGLKEEGQKFKVTLGQPGL